jgi:cell division protein FtsB
MGPGSRQDFRFKSLGWTTKTGVYEIAVGQDIVALEAQLAASLAHVSALEAQVQQLQNQPAPVVTPPDPKAVEALNAVMELAKALKLVGMVAA